MDKSFGNTLSAQPDSKDSKYEEWESAVGKINSWIANSMIPSIGNQSAKFDYPKDSTLKLILLVAIKLNGKSKLLSKEMILFMISMLK